LRSHSHVNEEVKPEWAPSDDEGEEGFMAEEDGDGYEPFPFTLSNGRKSRAKKQTPRV
jgi:hypothetical protein